MLAKLETAIERKRVKMQSRQQQRDAKIQAVQTKAAQAKGKSAGARRLESPNSGAIMPRRRPLD